MQELILIKKALRIFGGPAYRSTTYRANIINNVEQVANFGQISVGLTMRDLK